MQNYYDRLVWHARKGRLDEREYQRIRQELGNDDAIYQRFRRDARKLSDPNSGNWHHGFNSGVMATARLVLGLAATKAQHMCQGVNSHDIDEETEEPVPECNEHYCYYSVEEQRRQALAEFPDLDT